jgi:hypothetical protein
VPHLVGDDGEAMPASPARAASTAALSARMLVWKAISSIVLMIRDTRALESWMLAIDPTMARSAPFEAPTWRSTWPISVAASRA